MKFIPLILLFFISGGKHNLEDVRQQYVNAAQSVESAASFHESLSTVQDHENATLTAYKAASVVLLAKYESGLIAKTRLFNRGTALLESTIKKAPDNYEARLIRLNIQDNVPWITGYTGDIDTDKDFLIQHYSTQPSALRAFTKRYVLQSDAFSDKEKARFN